MEYHNLFGIYSVRCKATEVIYVGQVGSTRSFKKRFNEHKNHLKNSTHPNIFMRRAYDKYGVDAFEYSILEIIQNDTELTEREQYHLDYFNSIGRTFNISTCADSPWRGKKMPKWLRAKISSALTGLKKSPEHISIMSKRMLGNKLGKGNTHNLGKICPQLTRDKISTINRINVLYSGRCKSIEAICINTGICTEYSSITDAARHGFYRTNIKSALKTGKPYKLYWWSFL